MPFIELLQFTIGILIPDWRCLELARIYVQGAWDRYFFLCWHVSVTCVDQQGILRFYRVVLPKLLLWNDDLLSNRGKIRVLE